MKRVVGFVVIFLGLFLIFLAPFIHWYAVPRLEKAPLDVDQTVISNGTGTFFSPTVGRVVGPVPIQNIQSYKGDPAKGTKDVVVIDYQSHTVTLVTGKSFDYDREVFAMERKTGFAEHCCGENPVHSGLEVKFPFAAQQTTYQLWDTASNRAFPAKFVKVDTLDGVTVYEWRAVGGPVKIGTLELPGSLIGQPDQENVQTDRMYATDITVWAEPQTGAVLKGRQLLQQWAEVNGQKVLFLANLFLEYTPQTVAKLARDAKDSLSQLKLIKKTVPISGPIIGLVLAAVGFLLLRDRSGVKERAAPQPAPAGT